MNSFDTSRVNKSSTSVLSQSTTLSDKIVQCWMRQNHGEYQQLLIEAKQLQLSLLEQESKNKVLLRGFNAKKKEIEELERSLEDIRMQNQGQKNYLLSYYQHLNDKLKSQVGSVNLFAKLEALSLGLNNKLESQRVGLDEEVIKLKKEIARCEDEENFLATKKQNLRNNLVSLKEAKQAFKQEETKKKMQEKRQRQAQKQKYDFYLSEIQKLLIQKQHLESSQNVLKKLLNIQQVHKKHWLLIEKSIKGEFTRRATEGHYKQAMRMEYKLKANQMENLVNTRKSEISGLKDELTAVKRKRDGAKKLLDQSKKKYDEIESQVKQQSPRKSAT